jgi:hypothetical protein
LPTGLPQRLISTGPGLLFLQKRWCTRKSVSHTIIKQIKLVFVPYLFTRNICQHDNNSRLRLLTERPRLQRLLGIVWSHFVLFSQCEREKEKRNKKESRETEEIKTEIWPFQLQTVIIFDNKLRLRCTTWPWNACTVIAIFRAKK